jgi:HEAT repeat protein
METMRLPDPEHLIEGFLDQASEELRRAAAHYLISRGPDVTAFARRHLDGNDAALRHYVLEALADSPNARADTIPWEWITARLKSGTRDDLLLAARALGTTQGAEAVKSLWTLLAHPDVEVRRGALLSAAGRPSREYLRVILPLLSHPDLSEEALDAVAPVGDAAVPDLERLFSSGHEEQAQARAARALARIATPRAVQPLLKLTRGTDVRLRHLGLNAMARVRLRTGRPVLPRSTVHRLFLRELREYRLCLEPAIDLVSSDTPELRLLGESYRECADWALERSLEALACWYDPKPMTGIFDRLRSSDPRFLSPALEYLGHVLPRRVFGPVSRIFEKEGVDPDPGIGNPARQARWIEQAWNSGDAWLRACAVRAARFIPAFDRRRFAAGDDGDAMVRAELEALSVMENPPLRGRSC